jgi:hypothetical protein
MYGTAGDSFGWVVRIAANELLKKRTVQAVSAGRYSEHSVVIAP